MEKVETVRILLQGKEVEVPKKASNIIYLFALTQIKPSSYEVERDVLKMYFIQEDKDVFKILAKVINPYGHQIANIEVNDSYIYLKVFNEKSTYNILKQVLFSGELFNMLRLQKEINENNEILDLTIKNIHDKIKS